MGKQILVLLGLISALAGSAPAAVTEAPAPKVPAASPLVAAPNQPGKPAWLTPEKEAALVEVRKILKEARQVAEGIEIPSRLTTRGMVIKDLENSKKSLIDKIEESQFRAGDFLTATATKQPWALAFAQIQYGHVDEAAVAVVPVKLVTGTLLALIKMLAEVGRLDVASKVAEANLAKEQVPDWQQRDRAVVLALLASLQAKAGDGQAKETLRRALQAAQKVKSSDGRVLALIHISRAQAAMGDRAGNAESVRQAGQAIPARTDPGVLAGWLQQMGKAQMEGGLKAEGEETLQRAIQLTAALEPWSRVSLLGCIAWTKETSGDTSGADALLKQAVDGTKMLQPVQRIRALRSAGEWQLGLHQSESARQTARLMKETVEVIQVETEKAEALNAARFFATQAGDINTALTLTEATRDSYEKLNAMRHLATVLVSSEERDGIYPSSVIKQLAQEAPVLEKESIFQDKVKARFARKAMAVIKAAAGDIEGALRIIEGISDDDFERGYVYPEVIELLVRQGNLAGARQVTHAYRGKWIFGRNLVREIRILSKTQVKTMGATESLVWAKQLPSPYAQAYAMLGVAEGMLEQHEIEDSNALVPRRPWQHGCPIVSELLN